MKYLAFFITVIMLLSLAVHAQDEMPPLPPTADDLPPPPPTEDVIAGTGTAENIPELPPLPPEPPMQIASPISTPAASAETIIVLSFLFLIVIGVIADSYERKRR